MCGIFGFVLLRGRPLPRDLFETAVTTLLAVSEPRGQEASGLLAACERRLDLVKRPLRPRDFVATADFSAWRERVAASLPRQGETLAHSLLVLGHARLVTNGAEFLGEHNQPVIAGRTVGVHNGIVTNATAIARSHPTLGAASELDSEVLFRLIEEGMSATDSLPGALGRAFAELCGTASIACLHDGRQLGLATNNGSLHLLHDPATGSLVFTSERHSLERFLAQVDWSRSRALRQLAAGEGLWLDLQTGMAEPFALQGQPAPLPVAERSLRPPTIVEHGPASRLRALRRCTQCILPSTYPFITFADDGRCNYCTGYRPPELAGRAALEAELGRHRRNDGRPDCIVAFSGGRDSSYGLHVLVRELGMHPIAFTYDWGMVTGIARRNQARLCGALGVEHIVRSADIRSKRRYMRRNIEAWLRRPHLGMVPLFMAGDKFFYQIARELRQELGIPLVIFCAGNPLERTDFKGGFARVRESQHGQRLFAFSVWNKVQIAAFYGSQYLRNPAYLNESLGDSVRSFVETFVARDDFLYLYHYLPWDEATINRTLRDEYQWETAPHTDNTWRIGDGYTTFINYIYYTMAGFSEFDTFRSQQVRAGILTRDQALALAARDNQPDPEVLREFAAQVGLNLDEVLVRIELAPRLY